MSANSRLLVDVVYANTFEQNIMQDEYYKVNVPYLLKSKLALTLR